MRYEKYSLPLVALAGGFLAGISTTLLVRRLRPTRDESEEPGPFIYAHTLFETEEPVRAPQIDTALDEEMFPGYKE